jgi:hypothetical protein
MYLERKKCGSNSQEEIIPLLGGYAGKVLTDGLCGKLFRWLTLQVNSEAK